MMAEFHIRDIDDRVVAKLAQMAKMKKMSRNQYIVGVLTNFAIASEVKELDDKYKELFKIVIEVMDGNAQLLREILMKLEAMDNAAQKLPYG